MFVYENYRFFVDEKNVLSGYCSNEIYKVSVFLFWLHGIFGIISQRQTNMSIYLVWQEEH